MEEEHRAARRRDAPQALGEPDEDGTERQRTDDVQRPGSSPAPRQQRRRHEDKRVKDDLARRSPVAADDRQHRYARVRVVVLEQQGESPEVRRRPDEDDREEEQRRDSDVPGRGGPAHERRHGAGSSADHDVLRSRPLQPARVDDDVEQTAHQGEDGREDVHRAREQDEGERQQREPELERPARRHPARRDRARPRPLAHQRVDVPVEHVVEGRRTAAGEREPHHRGHGKARSGPAPRARDHPAEAGDQQQRHDPRLGERHVVPR